MESAEVAKTLGGVVMALNYDDYQRDYWAPDREQVLAGMQSQPIDPGQGVTPMQWTQQNNPGGITGYNPNAPLPNGANYDMGYNPNAGMGGSVGQQPNWQSPNWSQDQLAGYYSSRGVTPNPTSLDYWQKQAPSLYQRGLELGNPNYGFQRLQFADEFLPNQDPTRSPYYEAPQGGSIGGTGTGQIASLNGSQNGGTVAPTWTAMLNNGSAYDKGNGKNQGRDGLTLAQLIGMGR